MKNKQADNNPEGKNNKKGRKKYYIKGINHNGLYNLSPFLNNKI